jgi:hypothetical protein
MPTLPKAFNTSDHEPMGDFLPLPEGEYLAKITKSEIKAPGPNAKDQSGKILALRFDIVGPKGKGRVIYENLCIVNKNKEAERSAHSRLRSICDAVGFAGDLEVTEVLHGKPMTIKLVKQEAQGKYPAGNRIVAFKKADGVMPVSGPVDTSVDEQEDDDDTPF